MAFDRISAELNVIASALYERLVLPRAPKATLSLLALQILAALAAMAPVYILRL